MTDDSTTQPSRHSGAGNGDTPGGGDTGARSAETGATREAEAAGRTTAGAPAGQRTGRARTDRGRAPRTATVDPEQARRRRRRLIIGAVAGGSALIILLGCLALGALLRVGFRVADAANVFEDRAARADQACVDLETRLNRLIPPGATGGDPGRRAAAIRDENTAVRPFLTELEAWDSDRRDGDRGWEGHSREWLASWRLLLDARQAYANALDRQVTAGEPAFFVAPLDQHGHPAVETLERYSPQSCLGSIRRLARPDL